MLKNYAKKQIVKGFKELLTKGNLVDGVSSMEVLLLGTDDSVNELVNALDKAVDYKYKKQIKDDLNEWIRSEEFIDKIVDRIHKKQLLKG